MKTRNAIEDAVLAHTGQLARVTPPLAQPLAQPVVPVEPVDTAPEHPATDLESARPLVRASDLAKTFDVSAPWLNRVLERRPRQLLHAVDGVSFDIQRGQTLALVGESGCGKSTVARLLVGLHEATRGGFAFDGQDALAAFKTAAGRQLRRRIQMIFQDPYASLNPRWRVEDIVAEPLREHQIETDAAALRERVDALLLSVGLSPHDRPKYPHQFSGGQRQRVSIARALASQPEFLVCDEPTSALDVSVQAQVLNIMTDLQRERGLTYLFISHNLAVVRHVSDHVGVMYLGRLVELAPKHALFDTPRHPYTRMLLDAIPKLHDTGRARTPVSGEVPNPLNPPSGCAFNPRCPHANARCRHERPVLQTIGGVRVACHGVEEGRI
ncbi:ABC transporter ATP-binding protein [Hydrogenophaga sp.]|uniref:ABC transporter ATP-binding protein n=1 Tax=Hydrogenophaga sp. TaxID=1904254 RepID=UPI0035615366